MMRRSSLSIPKIHLLRRVLVTAWRLRKGAMLLHALGGIMETGGSIATIYISAILGNLLARYATGKPTGRVWFWVAMDALSFIVTSLGFWLMSYGQRLMYFAFVEWSTSRYIRSMNTIDYEDFYDDEIRNQINITRSNFVWQMAALANISMDLYYGIVRFIVITLVVAQISWWLIPVITLFLLPSLYAEAKQSKLQFFVWGLKGDERHVFGHLLDLFSRASAQLEIRSLQLRDYLAGKVETLNRNFYRQQEHEFNAASRGVVVSKLFDAGGVTLGSVVLIHRFLRGTISFQQYLFLSGALLRVSGALNNVFGTVTRLQEPLLYAETFFALTDRAPKLIDKPEAVELARTAPAIDFQNVSFRYPGSNRYVFKNLYLSIQAGEHVAIVGENGAGKSTLIKLLLRFYRPTTGKILINGHDLQEVALESWYGQLATLFQDFNRYPLPIRENISLSSTLNEKRLRHTTNLSGVSGMIKQLPEGADTVLDASFKNGVEPSGGQYQRVALARAFYRRASLIILDEPTAAIDAKAEYEIFNNIFDHYKDKTAIIVSHRFSTVRRADRIIVLDEGRVVEDGSHAALVKQAGLYYELFSKQAEGYQ